MAWAVVPGVGASVHSAPRIDLGVQTMVEKQDWVHPALPEVIENAPLGLPLD